MTQYTEDHSTHTAGDLADATHTAGIAGWTWRNAASGNWSGTVIADASAWCSNGKAIRFNRTSVGDTQCPFSLDGPGDVVAATAVDVLCMFRAAGVSAGNNFQMPAVRMAGVTPWQRYGFSIDAAKGFVLDYWSTAAPDFDVGATVTKAAYAANTWMWARVTVTAGGSWSWAVWADNGSSYSFPGYDVTGAADTTRTSGFVGVQPFANSADLPYDMAWFSVGTAGQSAPVPGGSPAGISMPYVNAQRMAMMISH